jgi:hypothetical protein
MTACGSSSPTPAQYAAKADAICASARTQTGPLVQQLATDAQSLSSGGQAAEQRLTGALQSLHGTASEALGKLRKLQRPSSGVQPVERFLASLGTVVTALERSAGDAAAGRPERALAALGQSAPVAGQLAEAARQAGMRQCPTMLPALGTTQTATAIHATLAGQDHHPRAGKPWRYTLTVSDAAGRPLSGTETTHYAYNGVVVGTEQPQNVKFTGGVYRDTIEFPPAAVGHPLELQVVVQAGSGSATVHWPLEVVK